MSPTTARARPAALTLALTGLLLSACTVASPSPPATSAPAPAPTSTTTTSTTTTSTTTTSTTTTSTTTTSTTTTTTEPPTPLYTVDYDQSVGCASVRDGATTVQTCNGDTPPNEILNIYRDGVHGDCNDFGGFGIASYPVASASFTATQGDTTVSLDESDRTHTGALSQWPLPFSSTDGQIRVQVFELTFDDTPVCF